MNIIHIETKNNYKSEKENEMKTIPIIKRIYYENGEIKFEISGGKYVPDTCLFPYFGDLGKNTLYMIQDYFLFLF